jgi:hypothetical protein
MRRTLRRQLAVIALGWVVGALIVIGFVVYVAPGIAGILGAI